MRNDLNKRLAKSFNQELTQSYSTRRDWLPNVQHKRMTSDTLGSMHKVMLTTKALRTIKKKGGFDEYLLSSKFVGDSIVGTVLRAQILEKLALNPTMKRPEPIARMARVPKSWGRVTTGDVSFGAMGAATIRPTKKA